MIHIEEYLEHPKFVGLHILPDVSMAREAMYSFHEKHGGEVHKQRMQVKLPSGSRVIFDGPGVKMRHCGMEYQFIRCHPRVPMEDVAYIRSRLRRPLDGVPLMLAIY